MSWVFMKNPRFIARGFSLIELMIAITLGALVVAATIGIFSTNRQTYISVENVARIQENARSAFEIMSRDIREAGGNACDKDVLVANVMNSPGSNWWSNWNTPVIGYEGAFPVGGPAIVAGTDALQLMSGSASTYTVASHNPTSAQISLNTSVHDLLADDILMICDQNRAAIFQMSGPSATNATVVHNSGVGVPGNLCKGLGLPVCAGPQGTDYEFLPNSQISRLSASRWYIANNGRASQRSLYRSALRSNAVGAPEEIAEGITNMQLSYLTEGGTEYSDASLITAAQWPTVKAIRVVFTLQGSEVIGTDGQRISRTVSHTATLRNRSK